MRCCHCLHESTDADPVVWQTSYIGGIGYREEAICQDRTACWARVDRARGLKDTAAIRADERRKLTVK